MSSQPRYHAKKLYFGQCARAMRQAVCYSVPSVAEATRKSVISGLEELRGAWRLRIQTLSEPPTLFSRFREARARILAESCPPFGAETESPRQWTCRLYHFCPYCWARKVQASYFRAHRAIYGGIRIRDDFGEVLAADPSLALWRVVTEVTAPLDSDPHRAFQAVKKELTEKRDWVSWPVGTLCVYSVQPDMQQEKLVARGAALFLISTEKTDPEPLTSHFSVAEATRRNLSTMLGTVCRYPAGLLMAPGEQVLPVLEALHGQPLWSYSGEFRERKD